MAEQATTTREQLVQRWRDLWQRLEVSHGDDRHALLQELRQIEAEAMTLIRREQDAAARCGAESRGSSAGRGL